jgi:hypothetical protein
VLEVGEVVLVLIGFLLEADVAVGLHAVTIFDKQEEPLEEVPDEEGQVEQFLLLCGVDKLVVDFLAVERLDRKDEAEQANGNKVLAQEPGFDVIYPIVLLHIIRDSG